MDEGSPRFVADAMLGSLARKLRILGFDTTYVREGPDAAIEALAAKEGRVLLTADRAFFARSASGGVRAILVRGRTDRQRLASLVEEARATSTVLRPGPTRCASCNVPLETLPRKDAAGKVPPGVASRHRLYYLCTSCGAIFWKGGHWRRLRELSSVLRRQ